MDSIEGQRMRPSGQRETEKGFMGAVIELAALGGWLCYHPWDSRRSVSGFPDLTLVRPPDVLFVELKRSGRSRLTREQRHWLSLLAQCPGVESYVWRPADWPAIAARLLPTAGARHHCRLSNNISLSDP